ncbi:MAG: metallophosphoesterase [Chryseolinea sp.]
MMKFLKFAPVVLLLLLASCVSYKRQYASKTRQWQMNAPSLNLELKHRMYLIGDAGNASEHGTTPALTFLKSKLSTESKKSSILFLGDNIYEYGMPPKEEVAKREVAEFRIRAQLNILEDFKGRPIFIPGNHDWRGWGQKGLKSQEKFVEEYINIQRGVKDKDDWENYFLPDDGCSGPEVVELGDNVVVLVVDSQWWLVDSDDEPKFNEGCNARNRASFKFIFENVVRKYKNREVVIAMHHPLYSYGPHGGGFTVKQHIFPLTEIDPKLYVPLPVLGSISAIFRATIGSNQDLAHQDYKDLRAALLAGAKKNGSFIFASGHEHALQYIENGGQKFVVSGSGSKSSPVGLGKGSEFASGAMGYSTLSFYEGGETWVQFYELNATGTEETLVFQKRIKDKKAKASEGIQTSFPEYDQHPDTVVTAVTKSRVAEVGPVHKTLLGAHHRALYQEKYSFPVLDLERFKGGVTPVKQGGGNQTNSLRVTDEGGRDYVLRGMTKDVKRFLPYPFNKMVAAQFLVEDNFLATLPFAPLAIPPLADAINVYHTNPKLYYVPAQPRLGQYNAVFGGGVHLVEERPSGKHWKDADFFGSPDKIISTPELTDALLKNNDHKVDEVWAVRTRLLDFLIGDWDRHDDQWTWASFVQPDDSKIYRPIPRDRDQAFSRYDGFVPAAARQTLPFLRQLQVYGPEIRSMKWTTWSARLFDRTFLNGLSWEQWEEQVKFIQQNLTDEVIEKAFLTWPERAQQISAEAIVKSLKLRRNNLMTIARTHFEFLGKSVHVIGTEERERFVVDRIDDAHTRVTVSEINKQGEIKQQTFQRTFENDITRNIEIYGNGDSDDFLITGDVNKSVKVRLIGGLGNDDFTDSSTVKRGGRKTLIYDDLRKNTVIAGPETADKRTSISRYNIYDRRGYDSEYDIAIPYPIIGYNPDDQVLIGGSLNIIKHTFKKIPYASNQHFSGSFAFGTLAFKAMYSADFLDVLNRLDLYIDTQYHGPTYAFNFAGLGNDTKRTGNNADYYRVRQDLIHLYPALKKRFAGVSGYLTLGPTFFTTKIENTEGRFISSYGEDLDENLFERNYFGGARLGIHYSNVDNIFAPHSGIRFNTTYDWVDNSITEGAFTALRSQLIIYKALDRKENFIIATQFGYGQNFGGGYEFFQMPALGGSLGLRGYRTERFYGNIMYWQSTDLRVRLTNSENPIIPFTLGLFGGFDYGRVWLKGEKSESWHNSYGGGIWVAPVDALVFTLGLYAPKEQFEESPRFIFRLGFNF